MKAIITALSVVPGWIWACIVLALTLHSCEADRSNTELRLALSGARGVAAEVQRTLDARVAAESVAVAKAVQRAREEERAYRADQQEKINELRRQNDAARGELSAARDRVRDAIYSFAASAGGGNMPTVSGTSGRAIDQAGAEFQAASGDFADQLLQLTADADEVTRERNTCVSLKSGRADIPSGLLPDARGME